MSDSCEGELPLENIEWSVWPKPPEKLRKALLHETSRVVRRRVWRRRARVAAGWMLAYAAGIATVWLGWPRAAVPPKPAAPKMVALRPTTAPAVPRESQSRDLSALSPDELRRRVPGAPRDEQRRLLQLAGDRYLYGLADVESALDCYRQVIELTPRAELAKHDSNESWLLAELKLSEIHYADRVRAE